MLAITKKLTLIVIFCSSIYTGICPTGFKRENGTCFPNFLETYGPNPILGAAKEGNVEVVKVLLKQGSLNISSVDAEGATPLFLAAKSGSDQVVSLLLSTSRAPVNKANYKGETPLFKASQKGHNKGRYLYDVNIFFGFLTPPIICIQQIIYSVYPRNLP